MAGDIIGQPVVLTGLSITSTPGSALTNTQTIPVLSLLGGSSLTLASGASLFVNSGATATFTAGSFLVAASGGTVTFAGNHFSMRTVNAASLASIAATNADNMVIGFQLAASGMSLLARSGNTIYYFNSAASVGAAGA